MRGGRRGASAGVGAERAGGREQKSPRGRGDFLGFYNKDQPFIVAVATLLDVSDDAEAGAVENLEDLGAVVILVVAIGAHMVFIGEIDPFGVDGFGMAVHDIEDHAAVGTEGIMAFLKRDFEIDQRKVDEHAPAQDAIVS